MELFHTHIAGTLSLTGSQLFSQLLKEQMKC